MNDKRSESERVSARPPLPSIAPPTDEIDSEWGADEIPAPAKVPQLSPSTPAPRASVPAAAAVPRASSTPAPRASVPAAAPRASSTPAPRPSAAPAAATPLVAASNPLRKQTLLGMAPVVAPRSEPPAATAPSTPAAAPSAPPPAPEPPAAQAGPAKLVATVNPLRKQTLLGIAPVVPAQAEAASEAPKAEAAAEAPKTEAPEAEAPKVEAASVEAPEPEAPPVAEAPSLSSIVTPAVVATDAPTTTDVDEPAVAAKKPRSEPARVAPAALSSSHDDLPELKSKRPRWVLPLGIAAVLALGVVGLRKLDRAPAPMPAEWGQPVTAKKKAADAKAAGAAVRKSDDDDGPGTGTDSPPDPRPTEPEPLAKVQAEGAKGAPAEEVKEPPAAASAAPSAASATAEAGSIIRINIESDPPGARMFWKGKEQGTTPFVLEFRAGERHAYEMGLPGYMTRKVVIDGSKTEISIGLRPDPAAPPGAKPRK